VKNLDTTLRHLLAGVALGALTIAAPAFALQHEPAKPTAEKKQDQKKTDEDAKDAKDGDKKEDAKGDDKKKKKKKDKTLEEVVEKFEAIDGFFKMYRDKKTGDLYMELTEDQLDKEFIYFSQIVDGPGAGGTFRGAYRGTKVIKFSKHFQNIEITEQNANFYFDPDNALSRAKEANVDSASIFVKKFKAKSKDGKSFLLAVNGLFKSEALSQIKPPRFPGARPGQFFTLGKLSGSKSRITEVKNYPENTSITTDYVYTNATPLNGGNGGITDARNVTVRLNHTILAMPENDFKPRFDDARVGYFLTYVNDMTNPSATPWRDVIHRWNLVKKDPSAAISEPVKPIVWWIENTTPENMRPVIKKAVEAWNIAFEKAGFKNAVQVNIQPDDADWDAGDIRYNVLRWTSSPQVRFGGYGPHFANPRTGEILGADIMLEYAFLTNRLNSAELFETSGLALSQEAEETRHLNFYQKHEQICSMAGQLQMSNMLGNMFATTMDAGPDLSTKLVEESIYYLMLHEVGHTLGLNHNMKASQALAYEDAHDISKQGGGLVGSVMDYPSINIAAKGKEQAHFYTVRPGDYDIWAIQFGYSPDMDDLATRGAHLARSNEKGLAFGNDADDMRAPGGGIDPRINISDLTDNAVQYAQDRLELEADILANLKDKYTKEGRSYQELRNAYLILTGDMFSQGRTVSRYIGGVYVDRSVAGQDGANAPYVPVEEAKQKQAMKLLRDFIFSPDAFNTDPELLQHIALQRRGFTQRAGGNEDPKLHGRAAAVQANVLAHLLHPRVLTRITDTQLYGNTYSVTEMMGDLTDAIFEDDSRRAVNTYRQQLQVSYVNRLIGIFRSTNNPIPNRASYDHIARSNAFGNLRKIAKDMTRWRGGASTRAHRDHVKFIIDKALEVNNG